MLSLVAGADQDRAAQLRTLLKRVLQEGRALEGIQAIVVPALVASWVNTDHISSSRCIRAPIPASVDATGGTTVDHGLEEPVAAMDLARLRAVAAG